MSQLQTEFDHKTAQLLAEQRTTIESVAQSLQEDSREQERLLAITSKSVQDAKLELSTVKADVFLAKDELKNALREIEIAQDNLVETRKQQQAADESLKQAKVYIFESEQTVSRFATEENRLLELISSKKSSLYDIEQQEMIAKEVFDTTKADREVQLQQLDAKLLVITTDVEQKIEQEQITRHSLAEWQARLEERDQNLRIRESKVEQGEDKIIRNSNLLSL